MSIWDPKHFKTIFGHMCGEHGDLPTFRGWSLDTKKILVSFEKQTKNRNETVSNLSLGTRLTVLSNVSDASVAVTQHRTAAWNVIVSLWLRIVKTNATSSSKYRGVLVGSQGLKRTKIKMIHPTSTLAPYKFTSKKGKFSRLERLYQTRKLKLVFQKYKL